jgi:hypothetical protein
MEYIEGHEYFSGLDFGQTTDFTVMPIWDKTTKCQVELIRFNRLEWAEQRRRIKQAYEKWHLRSLPAERNSIGAPNIEALRNDGVNCIPFDTTNQSKADIMSNSHECLHSGWKLLDIPEQRHEYNTFVSTQLPSGAWRLAAEGDGHDDIVISNGIALWYINNTGWWMS